MVSFKHLGSFAGFLALLLVLACGGDATAIPASVDPDATAPATTAPTATNPPTGSGILLRVTMG